MGKIKLDDSSIHAKLVNTQKGKQKADKKPKKAKGGK